MTTDLLNAVSSGQHDAVTQLLAQGADANVTGSHGRAPLHIAVDRGDVGIVELLLKHGASVDAVCSQRGTPDPGPDKGYHHYPPEVTPLCLAIELDNVDIAQALLKSKTSVTLKSAGNCPPAPPLFNAVINGREDIVSLLLDHKAPVNMTFTPKRETALHLAAALNNDSMCQLLLSRGAKVNAKAKRGTPLYFAVSPRNNLGDECYRAVRLCPNFKDFDCLYKKDDPSKVVKVLLEHGADVHAIVKDAEDLLHEAIANDCVPPETIKMLLEYGADVNSEVSYYETYEEYGLESMSPLVAAIEHGRDDVAKILIEFGADLNFVDSRGNPIFNFVFELGSTDMTEVLVSAGADINARDVGLGYTALHVAAERAKDRGNPEFAEVFLQNGADLNNVGGCGKTPFEVAVEGRDNAEVVRIFVREIVKMRELKVFVSEKNLELLGGYADLKKECEEEIRALKAQAIGTCGRTYFSMLTGSAPKLAKDFRNTDFVECLKPGLYKTTFPIYASAIELKFKSVKAKMDLAD